MVRNRNVSGGSIKLLRETINFSNDLGFAEPNGKQQVATQFCDSKKHAKL